MLDKPKKRYKDYKRIITMKTLDTSFYREGLPYLVKFNGDEKGKGIDNCDGRVGICIEASGGNLTFVFVSGTFVHEQYTHKVVSISCSYLEQSKIEIIPYWSDTEVLKLIDSVKHNPDNFHGYAYWNEEYEIYDQDHIEELSLNENFCIIDGDETFPLLLTDIDAERHEDNVAKWKDGMQYYNGNTVKDTTPKEKHYNFNMSALKALDDSNVLVKYHIKRKHLDEWKCYGTFKVKVLHNPNGFQMYHTPETDSENMIKNTWFPGDILSCVKGLKLEVIHEEQKEEPMKTKHIGDLSVFTELVDNREGPIVLSDNTVSIYETDEEST